ncbi:hypothetical protein IWQ61_001979 [Dispira simplex]|nr:hypothetical protein IWQ61_001979 [Dispira simplex]
MLCLEYLPELNDIGQIWPDILRKERAHYQHLRHKYITVPFQMLHPTCGPEKSEVTVSPISSGEVQDRTADTPTVDLSVHNPLSLEEDSPWQQHFQDEELKVLIRQDVRRTFPDQTCFHNPRAQTMLEDILFVYCKVHQGVSYRQGMHELLAPLWKVIEEERVDLSHTEAWTKDPLDTPNDRSTPSTEEAVLQALDDRFTEHDTFTLFCQLMRTAQPWFEINDVAQNASARLQRRGGASTTVVGRHGRMVESLKHLKIAELSRATPILARCNNIYHGLLKTVDPEYYQHLESVGMEPQLFGMRWIRLLWGREFPFDELMILWTALFADDADLSAVEYVCLAMLLRVRHLLMGADYNTCLQYLLKYSSLIDLRDCPFLTALPPFQNVPFPVMSCLTPSQFLFQQAVALRRQPNMVTGIFITSQNNVLLGRMGPNEPLPATNEDQILTANPPSALPQRTPPILFTPPRPVTERARSPVSNLARSPLSPLPGQPTGVTDKREHVMNTSKPCTLAVAPTITQSTRVIPSIVQPTIDILKQCEAYLHMLVGESQMAPSCGDAKSVNTLVSVGENPEPEIAEVPPTDESPAKRIIPLVLHALQLTQLTLNPNESSGPAAAKAYPTSFQSHVLPAGNDPNQPVTRLETLGRTIRSVAKELGLPDTQSSVKSSGTGALVIEQDYTSVGELFQKQLRLYATHPPSREERRRASEQGSVPSTATTSTSIYVVDPVRRGSLPGGSDVPPFHPKPLARLANSPKSSAKPIISPTVSPRPMAATLSEGFRRQALANKPRTHPVSPRRDTKRLVSSRQSSPTTSDGSSTFHDPLGVNP